MPDHNLTWDKHLTRKTEWTMVLIRELRVSRMEPVQKLDCMAKSLAWDNWEPWV